MTQKYIMVRQSYDDGRQARASYGIALAEQCEDCTAILESYPDMSEDHDRISDLVILCNRLELDPIHLHDVVEDFMATI